MLEFFEMVRWRHTSYCITILVEERLDVAKFWLNVFDGLRTYAATQAMIHDQLACTKEVTLQHLFVELEQNIFRCVSTDLIWIFVRRRYFLLDLDDPGSPGSPFMTPTLSPSSSMVDPLGLQQRAAVEPRPSAIAGTKVKVISLIFLFASV